MTDRKTLKIRRQTADRFEWFQRPKETQTDALARLLDEAGVPAVLECVECGAVLETTDPLAVGGLGKVFCRECLADAGLTVDAD